MEFFKKTLLPILLATIWISVNEFLRNQVLLKNEWVEHYRSLGLTFPAEPVNGAVWGLWSLLFAIAIYVVAKKFTLAETALFSWLIGFVMMWVVIGNLGVLPMNILAYALPLSIVEAYGACWIIKKMS